jgi:hypothetical protein
LFRWSRALRGRPVNTSTALPRSVPMPLAFFDTSFVSLPVQSSAYFSESTVEFGLEPKRYWPWLTHRIRFVAVLAGSKAKPVSSRLPPLAV